MSAGPRRVAEAVAAGKKSQCPRFRGFWFYSDSTEKAYPQRCGRWDCDHCSRFKRAAAALALTRGVRQLLARGERVRFLTLTDASGQMSVADWTRAWKRLGLRLSSPRKGRRVRNASGRWVWKERPRPAYLNHWAVSLEAHASGSLHLHALMSGAYIPQQWLSRQAREVGLGRVTHITEIRPSSMSSAVEYAAPDVMQRMTAAAYPAARKHGLGAVVDRSSERVRPLRFSRRWPSRAGPGGPLTKAEKDLVVLLFPDQDRDEGPYEVWNETELCHELEQLRRERRARTELRAAA